MRCITCGWWIDFQKHIYIKVQLDMSWWSASERSTQHSRMHLRWECHATVHSMRVLGAVSVTSDTEIWEPLWYFLRVFTKARCSCLGSRCGILHLCWKHIISQQCSGTIRYRDRPIPSEAHNTRIPGAVNPWLHMLLPYTAFRHRFSRS